MIVRPARPEDAATLAALTTELGYATTVEQARGRLVPLLDRDDHAVLVAEIEGRLVGWIHVFRAERVESDPFAEIGGLVVSAARRRRGVGAGLVESAEGWARRAGCAKVRVRSNVVRDGARAFYEKRGFTCSKRQAVFDKTTEGDD